MSPEQTKLNGALCLTCGKPVEKRAAPSGYPRDCAGCKSTQISNKRKCPGCGSSIRGEKAMRAHWSAMHGPTTPATAESLTQLQGKFNGAQ